MFQKGVNIPGNAFIACSGFVRVVLIKTFHIYQQTGDIISHPLIHTSPSQYGGYVPRLVTEWVRVRIPNDKSLMASGPDITTRQKLHQLQVHNYDHQTIVPNKGLSYRRQSARSSDNNLK
ncbi:hypothetical protein TNCV_2550081 [Trichonephila clavipes]|nr:hypothetical protein TNCV_2550081 [Trichonephila clavipes]